MMRKMLNYLVGVFIMFGLCQAAFTQDAEFKRLLNHGVDSLRTQNDLKNALAACDRMLEKYASKSGMQDLITQVYLVQGQIYRRMGRQQSDFAISSLKRGLQLDSNNPDLNLEMGLLLKDAEKFTEARQYLEKAVRLNENDRLAWQALLELNEKRGTSEQKIDLYRRYLAVAPSDARVRAKLAEEQLNSGQKTGAESLFAEALRNDPQLTSASMRLALLKEEREDWAGAITEYEAVLKYEPNNANAKDRLAKATLHFQKGQKVAQFLKEGNQALGSRDFRQWENARQKFANVLAEDSQNQLARDGLREANKKLHDHWLAEGDKAENTNSNRALNCFVAALVYADADQDRERAFEKQKQVAVKLGQTIGARNAQEAAKLALSSGLFSEALRHLQAAVVLDPSLREKIQPEAEAAEIGEKYQLGLNALAQKQYIRAVTYFGMVLDENPEYLDARQKFEEANRLEKIQRLVPTYKEAMTKHDWFSALTHLQELVKLAPDSASYAQALITVKREIRGIRARETASVVVIVLGAVMSIFLVFSHRFREGFINFLHKLSALFSRLRYGNFVAMLVIFLLGGIYYYLHRFKLVPGLTTLPGITILAGIVILSAIIIMALIRKRVTVRFKAYPKQISFVVKRPTKMLEQPVFVESLQLKSLAGLQIEKGTLREKSDGLRLAENNIVFRPWGGATIANIEFLPIDAELVVNALTFDANTRIFFEKDGRKLSLTLASGNLSNHFEFSETFLVKLSGCEIICEDRSIIRAPANKPVVLYGEILRSRPVIQFQVGAPTSSLVLSSVKPPATKNGHLSYFEAPMVKKLSFREKDLLLGSSQAGFSFREEYNTEKGSYEIFLHRGEKGELSSDLYWVLRPNFLHRLKIGFSNGASFGIEAEGEFSNFRIGPSGTLVEKIPTMLSWFVDEKRELALILGVCVSVAGIILSVLDLANR